MRNVWRAFLSLFFRLLYNECAWSYDLVAWLVSLGQWKAWGRMALSHLQGKRVLELGHGPGHLLVALARGGFTPVGLDLSPNMGRQAKRRLRRCDTDAPLVRARAQALPFARDCFDSVVATFPTEFIMQQQTLGEAKRVLAHRGHLIVALAAHFRGEGMMKRFLTWLYRITGQNRLSADTVIPWMEQVGLPARIVWEEVNHAAVMLVVAENG